MYTKEDMQEYDRIIKSSQGFSESNKQFNKVTGDVGEAVAVNYLKNKGYEIVALKYENKIGEIDIIAKIDETIVFIEVKMRTNLYSGAPREAINYHKQRKLRLVAESYLKFNRMLEAECRFDCIEIVGHLHNCSIEHLEGCF